MENFIKLKRRSKLKKIFMLPIFFIGFFCIQRRQYGIITSTYVAARLTCSIMRSYNHATGKDSSE